MPRGRLRAHTSIDGARLSALTHHGVGATVPAVLLDVPPELLEILACPKCHEAVRGDEELGGFACDSCRLLFPVEDGIPNFLLDEARSLDE